MRSHPKFLSPLTVMLATTLSGCFVSDELIAKASDKDGDKVPVGEDCDDDDASVQHEVEWYADVDGDGFGSGELLSGCPSERPATNTAENADDCDDSNPSAYPGAEERYYDGVDQDCAGLDADGNGSNDDFDQDADGWEQDTDCDDTDPELRPDPTLEEIYYDGIENDCDLSTGDGDKDGDGYWSVDYAVKAPGSVLTSPDGLVGDCYDDADAPEQDVSSINGLPSPAPSEVYPGAPSDAPYDGVDADCQGDDTEFDADGDGYKSAAYANREGLAGNDCQDCTSACAGEPDWSDAVSSEDIYPSATDTPYDGVDQDCGGIDRNEDEVEDDYDLDFDGYVASGYTDSFGNVGGDCVDEDDQIHPDAPDSWYDGVDQDCGGEDDYDADQDGYINDSDFGKATLGIDGWVQLPAGDCVDDPRVDGADPLQRASSYNPGVLDTWYDGFDHDCAGDDDFDIDADRHRAEGRRSSWGETATYQQGTVIFTSLYADSDDCDDNDSSVNPSQSEVANNNTDDNCDGAAAPEGIQGVNLPSKHASGVVVGGSLFNDFGQNISVGDVNGDGQPDMMVGSPEYVSRGGGYGAIAVYDGAAVTGSLIEDHEYMAMVTGEASDTTFGYFHHIGDLNGDGYDDVSVTDIAFTNPASEFPGSYDGAAWVLFGPVSASSSSPAFDDISIANAVVMGQDYSLLGYSLGAADIDADGKAELIVGAPYDSTTPTSGSGALYFFDTHSDGVYELADGKVLYGYVSGENLGGQTKPIPGDFNGDGTVDVAVGSPYAYYAASDGGIAYVIDGDFTDGASTIAASSTRMYGSSSSLTCGYSVALGDHDGDGYDDLFVGCPGYSASRGAVAVVYGSASGSGTYSPSTVDALIFGDATYGSERLGRALEVADVTGDGLEDLLVSGDYYSGSSALVNNGRVLMYEGTTAGLPVTSATGSADGSVVGEASSSFLGAAMSAAGDFDGDGIQDLTIARHGTNVYEDDAGDFTLFLGGEW